jgi:hypothetical protein
VAQWAQTKVGDSGLYAIALVSGETAEGSPDKGLIWLIGNDANAEPRTDREIAAHGRMAALRGQRITYEQACEVRPFAPLGSPRSPDSAAWRAATLARLCRRQGATGGTGLSCPGPAGDRTRAPLAAVDPDRQHCNGLAGSVQQNPAV